MNAEVVKIVHDVDFGVIEKVNQTEETIEMKTVHGTVLYVKGLVQGDPDSLVTFGIADGEDAGRICFYREERSN